MALPMALNFKKWIDENRHLLKPPVSNKMVWSDREFIVMVVGGPNARTDFHVNQSEEFFYQLEGQMFLRVVDTGADGGADSGVASVSGARPIIRDIHLSAGDIFLLPANTPHSPQRAANSVGLVIERRRRENEIDALQWYCEKCHAKLYEEKFKLTNIETQFQAVFDRYYGSAATTCGSCGYVNGRAWTLNK